MALKLRVEVTKDDTVLWHIIEYLGEVFKVFFFGFLNDVVFERSMHIEGDDEEGWHSRKKCLIWSEFDHDDITRRPVVS